MLLAHRLVPTEAERDRSRSLSALVLDRWISPHLVDAEVDEPQALVDAMAQWRRLKDCRAASPGRPVDKSRQGDRSTNSLAPNLGQRGDVESRRWVPVGFTKKPAISTQTFSLNDDSGAALQYLSAAAHPSFTGNTRIYGALRLQDIGSDTSMRLTAMVLEVVQGADRSSVRPPASLRGESSAGQGLVLPIDLDRGHRAPSGASTLTTAGPCPMRTRTSSARAPGRGRSR